MQPPKKGSEDFCSSLENLASPLPLAVFYTLLATAKALWRKCFLSNKTPPSAGIRHNPIPLSNKDAIVAFGAQRKKFPGCSHLTIISHNTPAAGWAGAATQ